MKDLVLVLAKGLIWLLLVMLLRPLNAMLDYSLAAYAKLSNQTDDIDISKQRKVFVFSILLIIVLIAFLAYLYFRFM